MLSKIYHKLYKAYGPQGWWPLSKDNLHSKHYQGSPKDKKDRFEIIVGAILTQNTNWRNVEKALYNLNKEKLIDIQKMSKTNQEKIASLIRPAGYFNQKAERLKILAEHLFKHPSLLKKDINELRKELLEIKGIGPETADSIILYAAEKPSFVVDAYTKRIFSRLGFININEKYEDVKNKFEKELNLDVNLFKEYHALIVEHAKRYCKTKPLCKECFLSKDCKNKHL